MLEEISMKGVKLGYSASYSWEKNKIRRLVGSEKELAWRTSNFASWFASSYYSFQIVLGKCSVELGSCFEL